MMYSTTHKSSSASHQPPYSASSVTQSQVSTASEPAVKMANRSDLTVLAHLSTATTPRDVSTSSVNGNNEKTLPSMEESTKPAEQAKKRSAESSETTSPQTETKKIKQNTNDEEYDETEQEEELEEDAESEYEP
jgi:hypothetical protein